MKRVVLVGVSLVVLSMTHASFCSPSGFSGLVCDFLVRPSP